jgi:hypothetical protein
METILSPTCRGEGMAWQREEEESSHQGGMVGRAKAGGGWWDPHELVGYGS